MRTTHFSITTLVAGLLFIALGVLFLLDAADVWEADPLIIAPILLIGLGVAFIAGSFDRSAT